MSTNWFNKSQTHALTSRRINYFKKSLLESEVIDFNGYKYFVNSLMDGTKPIEFCVMKDAVDEIMHLVRPDIINNMKFITPEAMGIPITTMVSNITEIPFLIARKRKYGLTGELPVEQITGYNKSTLYINGINPSDNVIIIDNILSTGGTIKTLIEGIQKIGARVISVIVLVNKNTNNIDKEIEQKYNIPVRYVYKIKIENNKVIIC
jgi:adenine phosphoribosyltransferase